MRRVPWLGLKGQPRSDRRKYAAYRKAPGRKRKPSKVVRPASKSYYCRKCMGYHRRASKIGKKHSKSDSSPRRPPRTLDVSCNRCGSIMRNQKQVREHFRDHPDHNDMTIP